MEDATATMTYFKGDGYVKWPGMDWVKVVTQIPVSNDYAFRTDKEATVKCVEGAVRVPDMYGRSVDLEGGQMVTVSEASGLGEVKSFDEEKEKKKLGISASNCSSAFILILLLCAILILRRT